MPEVAARTAEKAIPAVKPRRRVVTTTETIEVEPHLPGMEPQAKEPRVSFWEFMATTTPQDWNNRKVRLNLYRVDPRRPGKLAEGFLQTYLEPFTIDQIKKQWGGCDFEKDIRGHYRALVNENGSLIYGTHSGDFYIEGPPVYSGELVMKGSAESAAGDTSEFLAYLKKRAEDAERELAEMKSGGKVNPAAENATISLLSETYKTALGTMASNLVKPSETTGDRSVYDRIMQVALERLLNPSTQAPSGSTTDPLASLTQFVGLLPGEGSPLEKIGALFNRGENAPSWMPLAERALNMLPAIGDKFIRGLQEYRMLIAAQAAAQGGIQGGDGAAAQSFTRPPDPTMPRATPPAATVQPAAGSPGVAASAGLVDLPLEWFEQRIARMIAQGADGEDIANWLYQTDPRVLIELGQHSENDLMAFFGSRPILAGLMADPRLPTILHEFVETVREFKESAEGDGSEEEAETEQVQ